MKMDTMKYCLMENDCDKIIRIIDDEEGIDEFESADENQI